MLAYQLQDRVLVSENDKPFEFPNDVTIEVTFSPLEAFGMSDSPSRLAIRGHEISLAFDVNSGRARMRSNPPLPPFDISFKRKETGTEYELKGNVYRIKSRVENSGDLNLLLTDLLFALPPLLNLHFADPPTITNIGGLLGDTRFQMRYREAIHYTRQWDIAELNTYIFESFLRLHEMRKYARFATALHYFHLASRLLVIGNTPWEFMAEVILQMCKILQILFGNTRDEVRVGLTGVGYTTDEIERDFVSLMLLRDGFDVAHPGIAVPDQEQLQILYQFLIRSEVVFRDLLMKIIVALENGTLTLKMTPDLDLDKKAQQTFDQIIASVKPYV